ncbi:hypothetical protein [Anoxybacteroides tepidamans]|nr:hypothetical protein [Anoxybacillus tepidamans]
MKKKNKETKTGPQSSKAAINPEIANEMVAHNESSVTKTSRSR